MIARNPAFNSQFQALIASALMPPQGATYFAVSVTTLRPIAVDTAATVCREQQP